MKTEVYSWRVSGHLKAALEHEARRLKISLSALLDLVASEWLKKNGQSDTDDTQRRLHRAASKCIGAFASGNTSRSENVRRDVRRRLRNRHAR